MPRADNRGGKRRGAGRKPGDSLARLSAPASLDPAADPRTSPQNATPGGFPGRALSNAEGVESAEGRGLLESLAAPVQRAVRLYAQGWKKSDVAREVRRDRGTIDRWLENNPAAISEAVHEYTDPRPLLTPLVPKAISAIRDILDGEGEPATKLTAARDVLDRMYGKSVVAAAVAARRDIVIRFFDMDEDGGQRGAEVRVSEGDSPSLPDDE